MKISVKKIRIFKIKNRKGYAALCRDHLTEGKTIYQAYERMVKALKRSKIEIGGRVGNLKRLITSFK